MQAVLLLLLSLHSCLGFSQSSLLGRPAISDFIYSQLHSVNGTNHPEARQNFGVAYYTNTSRLFIFGGVSPSNTSHYTDSIWSFDTLDLQWSSTPYHLVRANHCLVQNGSLVYIIGGEGSDSNNFRVFNLTSGEWNSTLPSMPAGHSLLPSCGMIDDVVVVFGGCEKSGDCSGSFAYFNTTNSTWQMRLDTEVEEAVDEPTPRQGASLNIFKKDSNYYGLLIGGKPLNGTSSYIFNFTSQTWKEVTINDLPQLAFHTAVFTDSDEVIVFGGVNAGSEHLNAETYRLSVVATVVNATLLHFNTSTPAARFGHAAIYSENRVLIYGGSFVGKEGPEDVWQLSIEKDCIKFNSCGECLLAGCLWCNPNVTNSSYCVAGSVAPYVESTCQVGGWNKTSIMLCRKDHGDRTVLIAVTIVVLVLIAILVVATYVVDWRKGKASSGGYEPIGGI